MATLEKIRKRKKLLAIVIGAALLAFIIEVGIEALGRSGGGSTIAKVGGEKISVMDFQNRSNAENAKNKNQNDQTDGAVKQQQVLEQMIQEALINQECEKLGLTVTDREISELMIGQRPVQQVMQFAQQAGAESPQQLYDFINNPGKYGAQPSQVTELKMLWDDLTQDIAKQYKQQKLYSMLAGCIQANNLDLAAMEADAANTYNITYVKKDYSSMPDDQYKVTDADIKAQWEKLKPMFKLDEEVRNIYYIASDIKPSAQDIADADAIVAQAWSALQKGRGIDSVRMLGSVRIDTAKTDIKDVPANLKEFAQAASVGATKRDSMGTNYEYKLYKLIGKELTVDSVNVTFVQVPGDKEAQNKALAMLNAGSPVDSVAKAISGTKASDAQWQRMALAPDSTKQKVLSAAGKYVVFDSSDNGAALIKLNDQRPAKMFYTLATITYDAYAGSKTVSAATEKLQAFLSTCKNTKDFKENAAKNGFNAQSTYITGNQAQIRNIKDSRKAVLWAMDAKEGNVSAIFSENSDVLLAVAVDKVYKDDYMPWNSEAIRGELEDRAIKEKKGEALLKQLGSVNGTDLNAYATALSATIDSAAVVFAQPMNPKFGMEPALVGRVAGAKQGAISKPVKGTNGVYVFKVENTQKEERKPGKQELAQRFLQSSGAQYFASPQGMMGTLEQAAKVKRDTKKFF